MGRYLKAFAGAFLASLLVFGGVTSSTIVAQENDNHKITICHKNDGNGWSRIKVNNTAIDGDDGNDHGNGDHNTNNHQNGQDIIPPTYDNGDQGSWSSRNWDTTGKAIWDNGCDVPLSCSSINVTPAFGPGNKFSFGQLYSFSPVTTGTTPHTNYLWSISPNTPVLSSTTNPTTSWTAPNVPNPSVTWTLNLTISDNSEHSSCSLSFVDPTDQTATPEPTVNDVCANIDGIQTSVPGGLHIDASGKNCVAYQLGGPPSNSGGGQGSGISTTNSGQVLGATTTAKTGTAEDIIGTLLVVVGLATTLTSAYAYRKAFAQA